MSGLHLVNGSGSYTQFGRREGDAKRGCISPTRGIETVLQTIQSHETHLVNQGMSASYRRSMHFMLQDFARTYRGAVLAEISTDQIAAWVHRPGVSSGYAARRQSCLRVLCRWALTVGVIDTDPTLGLRKIRTTHQGAKPLTVAEVERVHSCARNLRERLMVELGAIQGFRCIEISRAVWSDVLPEAIRVRGKGGSGTVTAELPLADQVAATLSQARGMGPDGPGHPLVQSTVKPGRPLTSQTVQHVLTQLLWASGVKTSAGDGRSPHSLRHTAATQLIEDGHETRTVQHLLRHTSVATTERYIRTASNPLGDVMRGRGIGRAA